jgi:hypothetical protein
MKISKAIRNIVWMAGAAGSVALAEVPNPNQVHINGIQHGGPGCKQGTVAAYLSEDAQAFTLMFDEYAASQSVGSSPAEARKFCNISVDLHIPQGFQYTIAKIDYRGYVSLDRGVKAQVSSQYRFSGNNASTPNLVQNFVGPMDADYLKTDVLGITSVVWSPCGVSRALNIKSAVTLLGDRRKTGLITLDTIDGEFSVKYALQWRRCRG